MTSIRPKDEKTGKRLAVPDMEYSTESTLPEKIALQKARRWSEGRVGLFTYRAKVTFVTIACQMNFNAK
jgi:hypothetical protein